MDKHETGILIGRDLDAFTDFILPMGSANDDFKIDVHLHCIDSYGSQSVIEMIARVEPKNEPIAQVRPPSLLLIIFTGIKAVENMCKRIVKPSQTLPYDVKL